MLKDEQLIEITTTIDLFEIELLRMWERVKKNGIRRASSRHEILPTLDNSQNERGLSASKIYALTPLKHKKGTIKTMDSKPHFPEKISTEGCENIFRSRENKINCSQMQNPSRMNRKLFRIKTDQQKNEINLRNSLVGELYREKTDKKKKISFTQFQQKELRKLTLYYAGERRIEGTQDFTNDEGFPILQTGDSVCYRFQVYEEVARGSFGVVYKAYDHKRKEYVGLKVIKKDPKYLNQTQIEVKLLEKCLYSDASSNIVEIKYSSMFRGHPCIAFQLLHQDLYQFSKDNQFAGFPIETAKTFAIQILLGLKTLQQNNIIHCDLKPENLMLKYEGKNLLKIIDLGSGCIEGEQIFNYVQSRLYRSPEIICNMEYTSAIDMWSFGCILVELLTGRPLFAGKTQEEQIILISEFLGLPELNFLSRGKRSHKFFEGNTLRNENVGGRRRSPGNKKFQFLLNKFNDPYLVDFVKKILVWEPENRLKVEQALNHPFIAQYLPEWRIQEYAIMHLMKERK